MEILDEVAADISEAEELLKNFKEEILNSFNSKHYEPEQIFSIMAIAYRLLRIYDSSLKHIQDQELKDTIMRFIEKPVFSNLKKELVSWIDSISRKGFSMSEIRNRIYSLIREIDIRCAGIVSSSLPDTFRSYDSLNEYLSDKIRVLPLYKCIAMEALSGAIAAKEEQESQSGSFGLYNRHYSRSGYLSLNNFVILDGFDNESYPIMSPILHLPNYAEDIKDDYIKRGHQLRIGIFPVSNKNYENMFSIDKRITSETNNSIEGTFSITGSEGNTEDFIVDRCKEALLHFQNDGVDIAVFPEMLFTAGIQTRLMEFVKSYWGDTGELPWLIWLGSAWANRENKCMVIDRFGNIVFEQSKYIPFEYKYKERMTSQDGSVARREVTLTEDLMHEQTWSVNFIDIPGLFRISTAICRDISDGRLAMLVKSLLSDMMVIPAFSKTDRLSRRHIEPLAMEQITAVVCNACSALCRNEHSRCQINEGEKIPFCYVCLPAKRGEDNSYVFHNAVHSDGCNSCDQYCRGYIFNVFFEECADGSLSPKVTCV